MSHSLCLCKDIAHFAADISCDSTQDFFQLEHKVTFLSSLWVVLLRVFLTLVINKSEGISYSHF